MKPIKWTTAHGRAYKSEGTRGQLKRFQHSRSSLHERYILIKGFKPKVELNSTFFLHPSLRLTIYVWETMIMILLLEKQKLIKTN